MLKSECLVGFDSSKIVDTNINQGLSDGGKVSLSVCPISNVGIDILILRLWNPENFLAR